MLIEPSDPQTLSCHMRKLFSKRNTFNCMSNNSKFERHRQPLTHTEVNASIVGVVKSLLLRVTSRENERRGRIVTEREQKTRSRRIKVYWQRCYVKPRKLFPFFNVCAMIVTSIGENQSQHNNVVWDFRQVGLCLLKLGEVSPHPSFSNSREIFWEI